VEKAAAVDALIVEISPTVTPHSIIEEEENGWRFPKDYKLDNLRRLKD